MQLLFEVQSIINRIFALSPNQNLNTVLMLAVYTQSKYLPGVLVLARNRFEGINSSLKIQYEKYVR